MTVTRNQILENKVWDFNHPKLKRLADEYKNWSSSDNDPPPEEDEINNELTYCLNYYKTDGYELAKALEDNYYMSPDSNLVSILDGIFHVKSAIQREKITEWVKSENLIIPLDALGKKVSAKQSYRTYTDQFITKIYPTTYEVCISKSIDSNGGYIIHYENITFIQE